MATCPSCRTHYPDDVSTCSSDGEALLPDEAFSSADADLPVGEMVGEYRIEGKLGEGGFGAVFRAIHPLIGKAAAIKVLSRQYSSNPQMVSRFIAEARAVNQIRHRNIIDIFSFGQLADGRHYYVMELLEGATFDNYLNEKGRLSPEEAMPILRGIARALDAAHAAGIAHRDLKPENIFLVFDEDGVVSPKLLDFGIAKLFGDSVSSTHKTRTGVPMGTPYYMSPEQCRGKNVDHRTDIYSFGILAFVVLTGRYPFDGENVMDVMMKHVGEAPPHLSEVSPDLPAVLDAPMAQMLEKDPSKRPSTMIEAFDALATAARGAGFNVPTARTGDGAGGARVTTRSSPGKLTPAEMNALVDARTMVQPEGATKTLQGSEADAGIGGSEAKKSGGRRGLVLAVALVALAGVAGAVVLMQKPAPASPEGAVTNAALKPVETSPKPEPPPKPAAPPPTVAPAEPSEIELSFDASPEEVEVYQGETKLGTSKEPIHIKRSDDKITLTIKAQGYTSEEVEVTPSANAIVKVELKKPAPAIKAPPVKKPGGGKTVGKGDLEF